MAVTTLYGKGNMATNLTYMKGVRTRCRGMLEKELQFGLELLQRDVTSDGKERCLMDINKCVKKLQVYSRELEEQSDKLECALGDDNNVAIEKILDEDTALCSQATECYLDLKQFKDKLLPPTKPESSVLESKTSDSEKLFEIQREMQNMMLQQMRQQQERSENKINRNNTTYSTKLPKLEIAPFNGDKLKWSEFWDSFECTIHNNEKLSNVEKFNYLRSKLVGRFWFVLIK